MIISTEGSLTLREVTDNDTDFIFKLYTGEDFLAAIGDRGIRTKNDASDYIEHSLRASYHSNGFGLWVIELLGEPVGICGLVQRDYLPHADLGFALLPDYYGQGIARRSAQLVLEYAEQKLKIHTLLAITNPTNFASQKLLCALGFSACTAVTEPRSGEPLATFKWTATTNKGRE